MDEREKIKKKILFLNQIYILKVQNQITKKNTQVQIRKTNLIKEKFNYFSVENNIYIEITKSKIFYG